MAETFPAPFGDHDPAWDSERLRHRFFNPLTVVRGSAQTLLARELDDAQRDELLHAIVAASSQIERVVLELANGGTLQRRQGAVEAEREEGRWLHAPIGC